MQRRCSHKGCKFTSPKSEGMQNHMATQHSGKDGMQVLTSTFKGHDAGKHKKKK